MKSLKKHGHKGENGRVLVIGGSRDYAGAPYLAAMAALKIGADIAVVSCPEKVGWAINSLCPDLITKKYKCDYFSSKFAKEIIEFSSKFDAVLIGNGLSDNKDTLDFVRKVVYSINKPIVIDADAIKAVDISKVNGAIFTPHMGEFQILMKGNKDIGSNVILKKGPVDEIITSDKVYYNKTGVDRMAVAGTGDILAGIVVGLLARGYSMVESAKLGAEISGKLGELAKKEFGDTFVASDLLGFFHKI